MSVVSNDVPPLNSSAESWSTASASYAERVGRMCRYAADHLVQEAHTIHAFSAQDDDLNRYLEALEMYSQVSIDANVFELI